MTVLAQDPSVADVHGPVRAAISVPAGRLQRGPRGHRFHVVDVKPGTAEKLPPVVLHHGNPWTYRDRWTAYQHPDATTLSDDRDFRAQNVYAVAAHTLALFEQYLGRPVPWRSGLPQLELVPQAKVEPNASYSRERNAVLFGWMPPRRDLPALYTALSYDVIAHEVSHAVLDGLRPLFTAPSLPDQLAFHEALADLVALLSVFDLDGVAQHLLDPGETGRVPFTSAARADRAEELKRSPLTRLAEQLGARRAARATDGVDRYPALRRSVTLPANEKWKRDPQFAAPHRRAEVLVAAFMQTLVTIWAVRLEPLRDDGEGLDAGRVAEEGVKSARHLLAMLLRSLDYLPPVELEFADVIDAVLTADRRLAPDDDHGYRGALEQAFAAFGITCPEHPIVDQDDVSGPRDAPGPQPSSGDPDADTSMGLRYEHLNLVALRTSPEEVYQFLWNNAALLGIDVRLTTKVERVLSSTRVGPDGLVVTEILADYTQTLQTTAGALPTGITAPAGTAPEEPVELWGGGVLVFDQFGRFRLHQRQPLLDADRQTRRLRYLAEHRDGAADGLLGAANPTDGRRQFALLHATVRDRARPAGPQRQRQRRSGG